MASFLMEGKEWDVEVGPLIKVHFLIFRFLLDILVFHNIVNITHVVVLTFCFLFLDQNELQAAQKFLEDAAVQNFVSNLKRLFC